MIRSKIHILLQPLLIAAINHFYVYANNLLSISPHFASYKFICVKKNAAEVKQIKQGDHKCIKFYNAAIFLNVNTCNASIIISMNLGVEMVVATIRFHFKYAVANNIFEKIVFVTSTFQTWNANLEIYASLKNVKPKRGPVFNSFLCVSFSFLLFFFHSWCNFLQQASSRSILQIFTYVCTHSCTCE